MLAKVIITVLAVVLFSPTAFAQTPREIVKDLGRVKVLETSRYEIAQILYRYKSSGLEEHRETFATDVVEIEVFYTSGECASEEDSVDPTEIWKTDPLRVARIEVRFDEAIKPGDAGIKLSKFEKEQRYKDSEIAFVYHDRSTGWAFETYEGEIEEIMIFPSASKAKLMCEGLADAAMFYSRKSWFEVPLEERSGETYCPVANVESVTLSTNEIAGATADKTLHVKTVARDPENDVLTYVYFVSAGQIEGKGPEVTWDLTGVPPGTYTLTAGVDDGCGICGKTQTVPVVVK